MLTCKEVPGVLIKCRLIQQGPMEPRLGRAKPLGDAAWTTFQHQRTQAHLSGLHSLNAVT